MSLRTRVAIAVGVVVFCALAIVAAVVYPAVGANLRGQNDAISGAGGQRTRRR